MAPWVAAEALGAFVRLRDYSDGSELDDNMELRRLTEGAHILAAPELWVIHATDFAFAFMRGDDTVVTWGGDRPWDSWLSARVRDQLAEDVTQIYPASQGFLALKRDGSVVMWGGLTLAYQSISFLV